MYLYSSYIILGYGHITPTTTEGKLQFVAYITVGLPVMMVFLAKIGNLMAFALKFIYSRIGCRWCRVRRKKSEIAAKGTPKPHAIEIEGIISRNIRKKRNYFNDTRETVGSYANFFQHNHSQNKKNHHTNHICSIVIMTWEKSQ